jgi:hypothetical protein
LARFEVAGTVARGDSCNLAYLSQQTTVALTETVESLALGSEGGVPEAAVVYVFGIVEHGTVSVGSVSSRGESEQRPLSPYVQYPYQ